MSSKIAWGKSDEGFLESKDSNWEIRPLFGGCTRAYAYQLLRREGGRMVKKTTCDTQSECKAYAERLLDRGL